MSLFQARDWWSTRCGTDEEFDKGCLCVADIDNSREGHLKVITGSFQGMLRVYYPKQREYKIDDLVLEQNLEQPILQLEAGRFVGVNQGLSLAVLHPRRLSVYSVTPVAGSTGVSYYSLTLAYSHNFDRIAVNFTHGPFGGVSGRDFLCVQSIDGVLSFYEQETYAFSPNC
eukprot:GILI01056283.1.p1 GENE.GILI01056283.1~~GILI01056283.1.p1  ORF type:complete len:171 (+),score=15.28 GILI01056283.1:113-625(+)